MKIFSIDSPIYKFMCSLTNIFLLNLCWLIGSLPIVTVGASTVAAFDVALKMVDGEEGYVIRQFVQAYKKNVKQGILLGLIALACSYAVWMDFQLFNAVENNPMVFLIAGIITGFLFFCSLLYAFPQAARYENTIPKMLKNSFRISMKYFGRTLILVIAMMIEIGAFIWNSTTMFIGLLIGPACVIYTISAMAKPIFREIEKDALSGEA